MEITECGIDCDRKRGEEGEGEGEEGGRRNLSVKVEEGSTCDNLRGSWNLRVKVEEGNKCDNLCGSWKKETKVKDLLGKPSIVTLTLFQGYTVYFTR